MVLKKHCKYRFGFFENGETLLLPSVYNGEVEIAGKVFFETISLEDMQICYINPSSVSFIRLLTPEHEYFSLDELKLKEGYDE
jgi:hypothetical protein